MATPNMLRSLAALLAALAVVLNGAASGQLDAASLGEAALAFAAVIALVQAQVRSHAASAPDAAHPAGELGQ